MNPPANHRITNLTDEHSKLLRELSRDWTRHELSANTASRDEIRQTVKTLYARAGLKEPTVIICESIFQMTVYPVIIALMLDETAMDEALPVLRRSLQNPPWARFWENLDPQIESNTIRELLLESEKTHQKESLREHNRLIHHIYQTLEGRLDTHETPRLTSIGLQINSNLRAEVKALSTQLEKEISASVDDPVGIAIREKLQEISRVTSSIETQLDLQLMPAVLAQSLAALKHALVFQNVDAADKERSHPHSLSDLGRYPNSLSEVLRLIYQLSDRADQNGTARPLTNGGFMSGARIGAYTDPALRLIASTLQLELFKKSSLLDWLPAHVFVRDVCGNTYSAPNAESLQLWNKLVNSTYAQLFYESIVFVCEYPTHSRLDPEHRFHDEYGPALKFSDEFVVYFWHGRRVPKDVIEEPKTCTIERIEKERNVEIRSILIERYGLSRFLKDSGAVKVHEDEYGILYRKQFDAAGSPIDEPLQVVMVHNATPEPDGFHKQFFLRVPPNIRSAKEAVAWTFGMDQDDYDPEVET